MFVKLINTSFDMKTKNSIQSVKAFVLCLLFILVTVNCSPWPQAMVIRYYFNKGGVEANKKIQDFVPANVHSVKNISYDKNDPDAFFDIHSPADYVTKKYKTIVWIHGGAWISGSKDQIENYCKILASEGFNVIPVNYSIAPEKKYPTALKQLNTFLTYLKTVESTYNFDLSNVIFAGDSAGAQLTAQMANITVNPQYADLVGIQPGLLKKDLKGVILFCGAYSLKGVNFDGKDASFLKTVLWSYTGSKDFKNKEELKSVSVLDYINRDFPPTFISAGNVDPLAEQSYHFYNQLKKFDIPTTSLFYKADHTPPLNHEYQFDLTTEDGKKAFAEMVTFAKNF